MKVRALALMAVFAVAAAAGVRAQSRAGVSGKVVDRQGDGVRDVVVRFTQDGADPAEAVTTQTRKNGRFLASGLADGRYTVDLVDPRLFIASLEFRIRDANGLVLNEGQIEGHARLGVAGLPVSKRVPIELSLIVAERDSDEARERALSFALPELNAVAELYNAGRYEEAADASRAIVQKDPDLGEAHYVYGLALTKLERFAEAEAALEPAIQRIPDYPGIWGALGEVRMKLANEQETAQDAAARSTFARAAEALLQAVERDPESVPLQASLAACLDRAGDRERLVPVLERLVARDPSDLQSRVRLAALYSERGDQANAMQLLREIPATEKRAAVTIYNIAVRLNDAGDIEGSLLAARRAVEIDPELSYPRRLIAQILLGRPDRPAAIAAIREFLEIAPQDPEAESFRGILQQLEEQ